VCVRVIKRNGPEVSISDRRAIQVFTGNSRPKVLVLAWGRMYCMNSCIRFLKTLGLRQAGRHAFRYGCNRRWKLAGMNPALLRQQMGHNSAVMTQDHRRNSLEQVRAAFSGMG